MEGFRGLPGIGFPTAGECRTQMTAVLRTMAKAEGAPIQDEDGIERACCAAAARRSWPPGISWSPPPRTTGQGRPRLRGSLAGGSIAAGAVLVPVVRGGGDQEMPGGQERRAAAAQQALSMPSSSWMGAPSAFAIVRRTAVVVLDDITRGGKPDPGQAAEALHLAIRNLQQTDPTNPLLSGSYIHLGI